MGECLGFEGIRQCAYCLQYGEFLADFQLDSQDKDQYGFLNDYYELRCEVLTPIRKATRLEAHQARWTPELWEEKLEARCNAAYGFQDDVMWEIAKHVVKCASEDFTAKRIRKKIYANYEANGRSWKNLGDRIPLDAAY